MTIKFGGRGYQFQCPLCHLSISGSNQSSTALRIQAAEEKHLPDCKGRRLDPRQLRNMTYEQACDAVKHLGDE